VGRTRWGAYSAPPNPLAGLRTPTSKGKRWEEERDGTTEEKRRNGVAEGKGWRRGRERKGGRFLPRARWRTPLHREINNKFG